MLKITDTQSYGWVIQNVFFDALSADPFFVNYTKRLTPMNVVLLEHLPFLGVFIVDETMLPDGDADAGAPKFIHALRIGFSVIVAVNDMNVAAKTIDAAWWRIMNRLWTDAGIMNMLQSTNPDNTRIEGLARGIRRPVFGAPAANQQTPVAELRYEVTCSFRTYWPPIVPDDLLEIDVQTGVKPGDTTDEMAQRLQILRKYVFQPNVEINDLAEKENDHG